MLVEDGAYLRDRGARAGLVFLLGLFVVGAQTREFLFLGGTQAAVNTLVEQLITQIGKSRQARVIFQDDLHRTDLAVGAHDQVAIQRAFGQFLARDIDFDGVGTQGFEIHAEVGHASGGAGQQRHVEHRDDVFDCRHLTQGVTQIADHAQRLRGEQIVLRHHRDKQEVAGLVAHRQLSVGAQVLITFQQQGIGRGIELEIAQAR